MRSVVRAFTAVAVLGAAASIAPAAAATPSSQGQAQPTRQPVPSIEVASGLPARAARVLEVAPPAEARAAFARLEVEIGTGWEARWDGATGAIATLHGPGIDAPGAAASPQVAEAFAQDLLARHLEVLAPGADPGDFRLLADDLDGRLRTVAFAQSVSGLPVVDAAVGFVFEGDRLVLVLSTAVPRPSLARPRTRVSASSARTAAQRWVRDLGAAVARAGAVEGPIVLPIVGRASVIEDRVVVSVTVDAERPIGRFAVYLDAATGAPVARRQLLRFAQGSVLFDAPVRHPGSVRESYPAANATFSIAGSPVASSDAGAVTWAGDAAADVSLSVEGPLVRVQNSGGANATTTVSLAPDGSATWSAADDEFGDAQLAAYVHTLRGKRYVQNIAPTLAWLGAQAGVNVNIDDACNAFSDGNTTNFFRAKGGCENTGRLADVVVHELGHSVHANSIIPGVGGFEEGLSEGIADYLASTMVGDSGMGRGMFGNDEPLREIDPAGFEYRWPDDVGESHTTGQIISGALWDLRKALIAKLGQEAGVSTADRLWYEGIRRAVDIPTMYPALLVADDDDGDLANGTPNVCEIDAAFGAHGLRSIEVVSPTLSVEPPSADGYVVSLTPKGLFAACPGEVVATSQLAWRLREAPGTMGTLPMTRADDGTLSGVIPAQAAGQVVEYQVALLLGDGSTRTFPENAADPWYELFVGEVVPLYCNDFEYNPFANGWSHGVRSGPKSDDDWQWGPLGKAHGSGDPTAAYSGKKLIGNDLAAGSNDGIYNPDSSRYVRSPVVDTKGYTHVRLQYRRWLTVEDGNFDQATIYGNGTALWTNLNSDLGDSSRTHHRDAEWRFHDVDLSSVVADGKVEVELELTSDGGLQLGGWNVDDFCVVAWNAPRVPACGDGTVDPGEACDDGPKNSDTAPDACRTSCVAARCGDGAKDTGEACDDGNGVAGDGCEKGCTVSPPTPAPTGSAPAAAKDADVVPLDRSVGGCGCRQASSHAGAPALWLAAIGVAAACARRRRRA